MEDRGEEREGEGGTLFALNICDTVAVFYSTRHNRCCCIGHNAYQDTLRKCFICVVLTVDAG